MTSMIMPVMFYFVAIFFTIVNGLSGTDAGTQLLYFAPGLGGGSLLSMTVVRRLRQPKVAIILGGLVITVALGLVSWAIDRNVQGEINGYAAGNPCEGVHVY